MSKDALDNLFDNLKESLDTEAPMVGHQDRFLAKLQQHNQVVTTKKRGFRAYWKPFLGIAASIALIVTLFLGRQDENAPRDLAQVSPEMAITQDFFATTLHAELEKLSSENSPAFEQLKTDALFQIQLLEQDYEQLKNDLDESGDDKRVIHAMISNFQNRIDLLQNVLDQIDTLKQEQEQENNAETNETNHTL